MTKKVIALAAAAMLLSAGGAGVGYFHHLHSTETVSQTEKTTETAQPGSTQQENLNQPADFSKYEQLSGKSVGWGFKKNKGAEPDISNSEKELLRQYNGYYMDETKPKALYLTFDEGYENGYTEKILDVLKEKEVTAAFFVTGPYLEKETELVKRMFAEGHIVGNHTVNHPNLGKSDARTIYEELDGLNTACEEMYGQSMHYMRPPEGEHSQRMMAVANDMGYKTIFWSFAYKDWDIHTQKGAAYAYEQVTPYLHDGAILLLHAVSSDNAGALGDIIDFARKEGFEFRSLEQLQ